MERPPTRYADTGEVNIAYCRGESGPIDVVVTPGFATHLELMWEPPFSGRLFDRLSQFGRVTQIEKRGVGLSDRISEPATLEQRMDDLRAVMDASGCERAAVVGISEGAPLAISFAVAHPKRVSALILYGPLTKATRTDDYPWAQPAEWWEEVAVHFEQAWGSPEYLEADVAWRAPSERGNDAFVRWWGIYRRLGASPGAAADLARMNAQIDVRDLLPQVAVPTLVIARDRDQVISVEHARYVAERIPAATYLELPGNDHLPFVGDANAIVNAIAQMLGVHEVLSVDVSPVRSLAGEWAEDGVAGLLSAREREVLWWVSRGKANAEIATALYISESTVRKHLQSAYRKLGVVNRTAAVARLSGTDG